MIVFCRDVRGITGSIASDFFPPKWLSNQRVYSLWCVHWVFVHSVSYLRIQVLCCWWRQKLVPRFIRLFLFSTSFRSHLAADACANQCGPHSLCNVVAMNDEGNNWAPDSLLSCSCQPGYFQSTPTTTTTTTATTTTATASTTATSSFKNSPCVGSLFERNVLFYNSFIRINNSLCFQHAHPRALSALNAI